MAQVDPRMLLACALMAAAVAPALLLPNSLAGSLLAVILGTAVGVPVYIASLLALGGVPAAIMNNLPTRSGGQKATHETLRRPRRRNEEPMIERGLQLLGFCDEIVVVVDARTDDRTEQIARRYTENVWVEEFEDFAAHKNSANARAQGDWLLLWMPTSA